MKISLPQLLWYENNSLEIDFPDEWQVELCPMKGVTARRMTLSEIEQAVLNPMGSSRIRDLAQGKTTAVIIFDDMTRLTKAFEIAPIVIKELTGAGIKEEDITFVCALGTHGALTSNEFRKKLGSDILERFRVFNHNIYENCVEVGITCRGTRLKINREVAQADIKIAIGCVTAHPQTGYSGGGKIILPGIAHIDSITHYHLDVEAMDRNSTGMGKYPSNIL
jgi:lactate racemase